MTLVACTADEWSGRVWLDGQEVTGRCWGVLFEGEIPVAVMLYRYALGQPVQEGDALVKDTISGEIVAELRPRRMQS
jgi:hypothetical protein